MKADLHTHTSASDGSLGRKELLAFANIQGLSHVAICDHDTMANAYGAPEDPVNVIEGCELSSRDFKTGRKAHILCYLPKQKQALEPLFSLAKRERNRAGEMMVGKVAKLYPVVTPEKVWDKAVAAGVLFKQHIMAVLIDYGYTNEMFGELFAYLFSPEGGCCVEEPQYPYVGEVIEAARAARGVVALAHPSVYRSMELARELVAKNMLDAIEVYHPRNRRQDIEQLEKLCGDNRLLMTTGSDYHARNSSCHTLLGNTFCGDAAVAELYAISKQK